MMNGVILNSKIKELLYKTFEYDYDGYFTQKLDEEKFANLIIKECIDTCKKNFVGTVGSYPSAHNRAIKKCIDSINNKFGMTNA